MTMNEQRKLLEEGRYSEVLLATDWSDEDWCVRFAFTMLGFRPYIPASATLPISLRWSQWLQEQISDAVVPNDAWVWDVDGDVQQGLEFAGQRNVDPSEAEEYWQLFFSAARWELSKEMPYFEYEGFPERYLESDELLGMSLSIASDDEWEAAAERRLLNPDPIVSHTFAVACLRCHRVRATFLARPEAKALYMAPTMVRSLYGVSHRSGGMKLTMKRPLGYYHLAASVYRRWRGIERVRNFCLNQDR